MAVQQFTLIVAPPFCNERRSVTSILRRPISARASPPFRSASRAMPPMSRGMFAKSSNASSTVAHLRITASHRSWGLSAPARASFSGFSKARAQVNARPFSLSPRVGAPLTDAEYSAAEPAAPSGLKSVPT